MGRYLAKRGPYEHHEERAQLIGRIRCCQPRSSCCGKIVAIQLARVSFSIIAMAKLWHSLLRELLSGSDRRKNVFVNVMSSNH